MNLDTLVLILAILLIVTLAGICWYRKNHENYVKLRTYDTEKDMMQLPIYAGRAPPPCQPFVPSPDQTLPVPHESFAYDSNSNFQKFGTAYDAQMMQLPPVVKPARLNAPDSQPTDPYSGYPAGIFKVQKDINKFYPPYVPDHLWCKHGVCGN